MGARRLSAICLVTLLVACAGDGDRSRTPQGRDSNPPSGGEGVTALLVAGEGLYWSHEFDSAATVWRVALEQALQEGDSLSQAKLLTWLGLAAWRRGAYDDARRHGEEALRLKRVLGDARELSRSYNALGLLASSEDRLVDAATYLRHAMEYAEAAGDKEGMAKAAGNLGLAHGYMGDLERARTLLESMRSAARELGDARMEGNALANLATFDIWAGNPQAAVRSLEQARAAYERLVYAPGQQNALGQLATAYAAMGEYRRAMAALDSSLVLARAHGLREQEIEVLRILGGIHARIGDHRRALRYYDDAETLARQLGLSSETGVITRDAAAIHLQLGNIGRARESGRSALATHRAAGMPFQALDDLLFLALVEHRADRRAVSDRLLRDAETLAGSLDVRSARLVVALTAASFASERGEAQRVLGVLDAARPDLLRSDFPAEAEFHALEARAYGRLGSADSAIVAGRRAVAAVERMRGELASDPLERTLVADRASIYSDLVVALLRAGRNADAFAVADRARSRGLLENLTAARADLASRGAAADLEEGERLLRQIDALLRQVRSREREDPQERGVASRSTDAELIRRLEATRARYDAHIVRTARRSPRMASLLGGVSTTLEEIQASLEDTEALLHYHLSAERVILFVVTSASVQPLDIDVPAAVMMQQVRLIREFWGTPDPDWRAALPAAQSLHRALLGQAIEEGLLDGVRRLVIVPHGILSQLPFAALHDVRTGRFLMEEFALLHVPSAGALPALRRSGVGARRIAFRNTALAPFPAELPGSRQEVLAFRRAARGATTMLGASATERALRRSLASGGIVHVASHGILNARSPMFSRIELADGRARVRRADNDGRLEVHEVMTLAVRSPLVFLSGCETGIGEEWASDPVRGADHSTLAQAFLAAGAENVAGTLWRIDDNGAAEFAGQFYRRLTAQPPPEALAAAQRAVASHPRYGSPYYWAGYVLNGGGRLSPAAQSR